MCSTNLGLEHDLGVALVISTGRNGGCTIGKWNAGVISEGLLDMAYDGLDGKMIIFGLAFHFKRV